MNKICWYLFIVWFILMGIGCASAPRGPLFSEAEAPPPGYALVYLYRPDSPPTLRSPDILLNNVKIFTLPNKGYTKQYLRAGAYHLSSKWAWDTGVEDRSLVVEVEEGKEYFIRLYTVMRKSGTRITPLILFSPPGVAVVPTQTYGFSSFLESVSREQAMPEISTLRDVTPTVEEVRPDR